METEDRPDGTLSDTSLVSLLTTLGGNGETGVLRIDGGSEVYLGAGRIYLAVTSSSSDLASVLFDADVGTIEVVEAALASAGGERRSDGGDGSDRPPGAIDALLADRPDSEARVERLLYEYNLNSLFELLVPNELAYRFESGVLHPLGDRFATAVEPLLEQAQQRLDIWRRIAARVPSTAAVFTLAPRLPDQAEQRLVTADDWRFLSLLNGNNTVADIITETGESAFRVCSALYRMLLEDLVTEAEAPAPN